MVNLRLLLGFALTEWAAATALPRLPAFSYRATLRSIRNLGLSLVLRRQREGNDD